LTSKIDEATTKLASTLTVTPAILTEKVTDSLDTTVSQSTVIKQDNFETTIDFPTSITNPEIKNLLSLSSTMPLLTTTTSILTSSKEVETTKGPTIEPSQTSSELSTATNKIELVHSTTLSITDKVALKSVSIPISIADLTTAIFITKTPILTTTLPIASTKIIGQSSSTVLSETSTRVISSSLTNLVMNKTSTPIQQFTTFLPPTTTTSLQNSTYIIPTSSLKEVSSSTILPLIATETQIIDTAPLTTTSPAITNGIPVQDTQSISYSTPNIKTTTFLTPRIIDLTTFFDTIPSVSTTSTPSIAAATTKITENFESSKTSTFYSTPAITNSTPFSTLTITTPIQFISESTTSNRETTEPSALSITSTVGSLLIETTTIKQLADASIETEPKTTSLLTEKIQTYSSSTLSNFLVNSEIVETTSKISEQASQSIENSIIPITFLPTTPKITSIVDEKTTISNLELKTTSILSLVTDALNERTSFFPIHLHLNQENGEKIESVSTTSITPKTSFLIFTSSTTTPIAIKAQTSNDLISTSFMVTQTTPFTTSFISSPEALASQTTKIESINLESTKKIIPTTSNPVLISTSSKEIHLNTDTKSNTLTSTSSIRLSSTNLPTSYETSTKIDPVSIEYATFTAPSSTEMIQTSFSSLTTAIVPETIIENNSNLKSDTIKPVTLLPTTTKITSTIIDQTTISYIEIVTTNILSLKTNSVLDKASSTSTLRITSNLNELNEDKISTKSILTSTVAPMASLPISKETELIPFTTATNPQTIQTLNEVMSTAKLFSTSQIVSQTTPISTTISTFTSAKIESVPELPTSIFTNNNNPSQTVLIESTTTLSAETSIATTFKIIDTTKIVQTSTSLDNMKPDTTMLVTFSPTTTKITTANVDEPTASNFITSNLNPVNEINSTNIPITSVKFSTASIAVVTQSLNEMMDNDKLLSTTHFISQTTQITTTVSSAPEALALHFDRSSLQTNKIESIVEASTSISKTSKILDTTTPQKVQQTSTTIGNLKPGTAIPTTTKLTSTIVDQTTISYIEIGKTNILSLQTDSFLSKTSLEMPSSTSPVNEEQAISKASLQILTSSITTPIRITSQMADLSTNISPELKANKIDDYDHDILSTPLSSKTETPFLIKSETSTSTTATLIYSSTTKLAQDIPIEKVISTTTKLIQEESLKATTLETTRIALDNLSTSILQVITTTILPSTTKTIFINHAELETLANSDIKIEPTYTLKIEPLTSISLPTITRNTLLLTKATEDNSNILTTTPNTGDILTETDHSTLYLTSPIINAVKSAKKKTDQLEIVRNEKKQIDHSNKIHEKIFFCNFDNFEETFSNTNLAQFGVSSNGVLNIISNISASSNHITDITSICKN
jgi:hypothetical protein